MENNIVENIEPIKTVKFLFIRFSSIGDIVLTTPSIRCLKQQFPNAEIHFLVKQQFKSVIENNPYISNIITLGDSWDVMLSEVHKTQYDYVIDLHKNIRSYRLIKTLNTKLTKVLSYKKLSFQKFLLTKLGVNFMPKTHISVRCINALKPLGIADDGKGLDYYIADKDVISNNDLPASHSFGFIAIVIGASYFTKKLPVHKLQALCKAINYPIILVGAKEEIEEGNEIASIDDTRIYNACGKFNLNESADIVRRSKLVISHDTGLLYIACAFNKKVIAVWGGTSPKLAVEPFYGTGINASFMYKNKVVPNISCQPCSNYGTKICPKKHFKCMELQDIELMAKDAVAMLKN